MSGEADFTGDVEDSHEMTEAMKSINDISQRETFLVVNIGKLKSKVDSFLSQLD